MTSLEIGRGGGTPDHIAAQIVTGIGFLGGGAILRSGKTVHGHDGGGDDLGQCRNRVHSDFGVRIF